MRKWTTAVSLGALLWISTSLMPIYAANTDSTFDEANSANQIYDLELERWNIYNDGTHSIETTQGFNQALKWASENGKTIFKVPDGTYLIAKGASAEDTSATINLVSNITLELGSETVLQKETNGYEGYSVIHIGDNAKNVTVKGGILRGDRDTHDYSQKMASWSAGTHEWGYGIDIAGAEHVIVDGVRLEKFTGDGVNIVGTTQVGSLITEQDVEEGGLDEQGEPIAEKNRVRSNNRKVTNFDNPKYKKYRNIFMWQPQGIIPGSKFDVFYYKADGSFIKSDKQLKFYFGESIIPEDADYFRVVYDAASTKGISVYRMTIANSKNIVIQNSDIGYNRRQGITAGGENVQILNNTIHHTSGGSPSSGIDIEPGFYPAKNHLIQSNRFIDNKIQVVLSYGENVIVDGNEFEQKDASGVGLHIHPGFWGDILVKDNNFNGSGLTVNSNNTVVKNNNIANAQVYLGGQNLTFDTATLLGASLRLGFNSGQEISNTTIVQNGSQPFALYVGDKQIRLNNVAIKATAMAAKKENLILGSGMNDNIYDNLNIDDTEMRGTVLPAGTYNGASFTAGGLGISGKGKYVINNSFIQGKDSLLNVNNLNGEAPSVTIKCTKFEMTDNIRYAAAIYVQGAKEFNLLNSSIFAENHEMADNPLIKIGPYGLPKATQIFDVTLRGNSIHGKKGASIIGVDTSNAGTDTPPYVIENNTLFNTMIKLKANDLNRSNRFEDE